MSRNVWGHRGCRGSGHSPENSLSAFQAAIQFGVDGIELDVQLTKDGVLVVFHDTTLERMTGVTGTLSSHTLSEIKTLRLSARETVPTLDQVLDLVDARRKAAPFVINIEMKDPHSATAVAAVVQKRLDAGWKLENFLISSFDMDSLREIRTLNPTVPIGTLFECTAEELSQKMAETADLKPCTINIPFPSLTHSALDLISSAHALAVVWTPNEENPYDLSQTDRELLLKRLRERDFVVITDYPKELLQLLKPNKARATATGVLAACLSYGQQNMLFRPSESGLEKLKSPADYPELKRFGFRELQITADDGIDFTVWERSGSVDRPHFLLFHGNRAHWGDTGAGDRQRDRRARLKFIAELASSGSGVTAVTLRGFGRSLATPSESGFLLDLRAVTDHICRHRLNNHRLVVAGESLGTWAATQTAVYLTERASPPALLSLQNPFTCMAEVGQDVVSQFAIVRSLNLRLSALALDRHVLRSHFYTANLLSHITQATVIHIATSGKDDLVDPTHSDRLAEIASKKNLRVVRDIFPEALHHNIPPVPYARRLICLAIESCVQTTAFSGLWDAASRPILPVDYLADL